MVMEIESVEKLERIASLMAAAIQMKEWYRFRELLIELAEEIKRQSVEP